MKRQSLMLDKITPIVITYNEDPNIGRSLEKLAWAKKIIVVDSFSDDKTLSILKGFPGVCIFQRKFDTFASQCNYALQQVDTEWALSLDADYILSDQLIEEIKNLQKTCNVNAYYIKFRYCIFGEPLRATLLPPRQILFRTNQASYVDDGHAHCLKVQGKEDFLKSYIYHDDRKSLGRWLQSQDRYATAEAKKLRETPTNQLNLQDRIRRHKIFTPFLVALYCLFYKGLILDGWHGFYYSFQRMLAEIWLSVRLMDLDRK